MSSLLSSTDTRCRLNLPDGNRKRTSGHLGTRTKGNEKHAQSLTKLVGGTTIFNYEYPGLLLALASDEPLGKQR